VRFRSRFDLDSSVFTRTPIGRSSVAPDSVAPMSARERWATQLAAWALPEHILSAAPESPWSHDTATFAVDTTVDPDLLSARVAREVLTAGDTVVDVGCGGGRASVVLVPPAHTLVGVDESEAMLTEFSRAAADAGATSHTRLGRWPDVADITPSGDLVVCHHVAYNVAAIAPFVRALTAAARRSVVVVLPVVHPQTAWSAAWKHFWDLDRPSGPTSDDFVEVLDELGIESQRWEMPRPELNRHTADPATRVPTALRRLCLGPERADDVAAYLTDHEPAWVPVHTILRWRGDAPE
jgi:SAM-dependent methyltransferase